MDDINKKDENKKNEEVPHNPHEGELNQTRYKDIDDKDYDQGSSLSMKLSFWYYWHAFVALVFTASYAFYFISIIPVGGLRIYDILGKPGVSKSTSKFWLNILKIRISDNLLVFPLYAVIVFAVVMIIYYLLKVKTTQYNLNFRFLEVKEGVLNQTVNQIDLFSIKDEVLERPLLFRILGISRLTIMSNDKTHPVLKIPGVNAHMADKFLNFIRTNAYSSSTEYWVSKDRRRRNEKGGPSTKGGTPIDKSTILGDGDIDE
jgi:membrane protein YdbS with pleckstrin-like domain